jgi:hypothetical protein
MEIIVLQHIKVEDPGYIKDLMLADGWKLTTIELDEGDKIPIIWIILMLCLYGWSYGHLDGRKISLAHRGKKKNKRICC